MNEVKIKVKGLKLRTKIRKALRQNSPGKEAQDFKDSVVECNVTSSELLCNATGVPGK